MLLGIRFELACGPYRFHESRSVGIGVKELVKSALVGTDIFNCNLGKNILCYGINDSDLFLNRNGRILILFVSASRSEPN